MYRKQTSHTITQDLKLEHIPQLNDSLHILWTGADLLWLIRLVVRKPQLINTKPFSVISSGCQNNETSGMIKQVIPQTYHPACGHKDLSVRIFFFFFKFHSSFMCCRCWDILQMNLLKYI